MRTINTDQFKFAHSKNPRGFGFWMFETRKEKQTFEFYGFYADAAKAARKALEGLSEIILCS